MFDMVTPPFGCITVNQIQNGSPAPPKAKRIQCPLFTILGCCWDCCPFIYQHLENPRLALQSGPTISAGKDLRSAYRPIARASLVAQWLKKKKKICLQCRRICGSIPGSGRSPGGGNGNPLQYSCLENPMDRRAWLSYSLWGHKESDTSDVTVSLLRYRERNL